MFAFGTKRTSNGRLPMSAFGGKADIKRTSHNVRFWPNADIEDSLPPKCVFGSWLMVSCRARASADEEKSFNDCLLDQLPFDTGWPSWSIDCGRCLARARGCCTRRRANTYPRDAEDGGAVRTGRTERRGRTDRRGRTERGARPQRDSGKSRRGGRNDRVAPRVAIDARRLRIRPCQQRHPCLEPGALQNAALQHAH